jgi:hypothetical protein
VTIDEYELEAMHAREARLDRDVERERFDAQRMRRPYRPRYSRFRTLNRLMTASDPKPPVLDHRTDVPRQAA